MEQFKIREEYTEKIREYDRYILSKKKQGRRRPYSFNLYNRK